MRFHSLEEQKFLLGFLPCVKHKIGFAAPKMASTGYKKWDKTLRIVVYARYNWLSQFRFQEVWHGEHFLPPDSEEFSPSLKSVGPIMKRLRALTGVPVNKRPITFLSAKWSIHSRWVQTLLIYAMQFVTMETHLHASVACVSAGAGLSLGLPRILLAVPHFSVVIFAISFVLPTFTNYLCNFIKLMPYRNLQSTLTQWVDCWMSNCNLRKHRKTHWMAANLWSTSTFYPAN